MWFFIFESLALLSIASVVGVVAGFLVWGGRPAPVSSAAAVGADQAHLWAEINNRNADVARLRHKLKRAVIELERRAQQVVAARDAHDNLLVQLDALGAQLAVAQEGLAIAGAGGPPVEVHRLIDDTRAQFEQRLVDEREAFEHQRIEAAARVTLAEQQLADAHRELERSKGEASEAHGQVQDLAARLQAFEADLRQARDELSQAEAEAGESQERAQQSEQRLARVERSYEDRVASLEVDLASARLRTDVAAGELVAFRNDLGQLHDANARHLAASHSTIGELSTRLDRASAALNDRAPRPPTQHAATHAPATTTPNIAAPEVASPEVASAEMIAAPLETPTPSAVAIDLRNIQLLPGVDRDIAGHLEELGIQSLTDIAGWTESDVERFQAWLPDHPRIVADNDWVAAAARLVETARGVHGGEPDDPAGARERS